MVRVISKRHTNINPTDGNHVCECYADTDLGGCVVTGRSFMCGIGFAYGLPIFFKCKKQKFVRLSSTATELKGLTFTGHYGMYMNEIILWMDKRQADLANNITEIGFANGPITLHGDNEGAKRNADPSATITNLMRHERLSIFHIKELVKFGWCRIVKINGKLNPADIGTKDQKMYGEKWYSFLKRIGLFMPTSKHTTTNKHTNTHNSR